MKNFYKRIEQQHKLVVTSIINSEKGGRLYAKVQFLDKAELGLLDTGTNISYMGSKLAAEVFSRLQID